MKWKEKRAKRISGQGDYGQARCQKKVSNLPFPLLTYSYCNNHFPIDEPVSSISKLKHHTEYCNSQDTNAANLALIWKNPILKCYNLRHYFLKYKQFNLEDRYAVFLSINIKFLQSITV